MSTAGTGVFAVLPPAFFSPLSGANREHYAALLGIYYRLFQETPHGVERNRLVERYSEYLGIHRDQLAATEDEEASPDSVETGAPLAAGGTISLDNPPGDEGGPESWVEPVRYMASRFLRTLLRTGWVAEETLPDFTRVVNMEPGAKPFFEALARVDEGLATEYESHVVAVYSLLCTDAASENGHYAVLNAHNATMALIDSLKVLSQSIREYYARLLELADAHEGTDAQKIASLLHLHYDRYAPEVLDGAYKRLKTSDNLSRYRPRIVKRVAELLSDDAWLEASAYKYAQVSRVSIAEARVKLSTLLVEIRDVLRAVDPLLDEIDRRNMLYAKASIERVKTLVEPASSVAGKIALLAKAVMEGNGLHAALRHKLFAVQNVAPDSRYRRWLREAVEPEWDAVAVADPAALERAEVELRLRLERQLSPGRISGWLDSLAPGGGPIRSGELVSDTVSLVRFLHALVYAESRRPGFKWVCEQTAAAVVEAAVVEAAVVEAAVVEAAVVEAAVVEAAVVEAAGWRIPDISLRRLP